MAVHRDTLAGERLDSWKEIAAFFGRAERTVKRWESERGLPVHRLPGSGKGSVFAYTGELSAWLAAPQNAVVVPLRPAGEDDSESSEARSRFTLIDGGAAPDLPTSEAPFQPLTTEDRPELRSEDRSEHRAESRWAIISLVAAVLAGALLTIAILYRHPGVGDSVAVLPFANGGGDPAADYLSDGITESLIDNLTHVPQLKVRSRNSVFHYKGKDVDAHRIGGDLGVSLLVSGRVLQQGDTIEVRAELTDVRDNTEVWGQHYRGKSADILSLQQEIAGDLAEKLRSQLSPSEKQQVTRQGTQSPEAYELYLKGRYAWNKRTIQDLATAISYFNQAIAKDPNYALAYSGLADAYSVLPNFGANPSEVFPKSNAAARRALELDPTLAHPHAVLGMNETQYDWDFAGGEAEFKKALQLDPNDATAHQWYAESIDRVGGRRQEAIAEIDRARQLEPLSPVISRVLGGILVTARQSDKAIEVCQKLANENPTFAIAHDCLAQAYWAKRMYPQVIEEWKKYAQLTANPQDAAWANALDQGFRSAGWKGALTQGLAVRVAQFRAGFGSPVQVAQVYADLGDNDQAFQWLNTAYQDHDWLLIGLNTDVRLDPVRSDPRFQDLVRKVGLPLPR